MTATAAAPLAAPVPFDDLIDFGDLSEETNALLQQGVLAYRADRAAADALFRQAIEQAPHALPAYFCLYKIHTYQGNLDAALAAACAGLREAARQAGWPGDWTLWVPLRLTQGEVPASGPARFALYTLKALAFIHLRRHEEAAARAVLRALDQLDPSGATGWPVVAALVEGAA